MKYYFNIFALNTNTGRNMFFQGLYLTRKELKEQASYLMAHGFNSITYLKVTV